jgi:hypothetical protein
MSHWSFQLDMLDQSLKFRGKFCTQIYVLLSMVKEFQTMFVPSGSWSKF